MAPNFVVQDGDKLAFSGFIIFAGILQRLGKLQNIYPYVDPR